MKVLYLDESGDHRLKRINPTYPIFVLGGIVVDREYVREVMEPRVRQFKHQFFGRDDVILHTVDIRNNAGDFAFLIDPVKRGDFFSELNSMLDELEFTVISVVIKKTESDTHLASTSTDLYMYAFELIIERFCWDLGIELDGGFICAEKRNPTLDRELMNAWETLRSGGHGTGIATSRHIDDRIVGFDLRDKRPNLAGMQIADLVITPVGRHVLGSPEKDNQVQWSVVERKLRRIGDLYWGVGLVVRP